MTAKQLKAKAPFFWQAVEDGVYADCIKRRASKTKTLYGIFYVRISDKTCRSIAVNAAFIATSEFVSRAGKHA